MKKILFSVFILSSLAVTSYGAEVAKDTMKATISKEDQIKEGKKVLKEIREQIKREEKLKAKELARKQEEARKKAEQIAKEKARKDKEGKKVLKEIRDDLNESLELKVFRAENNQEAKTVAAAEAFKVGKDRLAFLRAEEKEINKYKKDAKAEDGRKLLDAKFQETYDQFQDNQKKIKELQAQNAKLKKMKNRLDSMENHLK